MRIIYVDTEFRCHISNDGTMTPVETDFFDGKCDVFVEGYRFIQNGETWTRSDGIVFQGEMITPWKDYSELDKAQRKYEKQLLIKYENEKNELNTAYIEGVNSI